MHWAQEKLARLFQPIVQQTQAELDQARDDINRLNDELDEMQITLEGKDRQLRASAEALAQANGDVARSRKLANQLQTALDNERRFIKQMGNELGEARKNRRRR